MTGEKTLIASARTGQLCGRPYKESAMPVTYNTEEQQILDSFTGRIRPVPISFGYGVALGLVALVMVLLPLIYLGIASAVAWAWWWYFTHGMALFSGGHGSSSIKAALLMYGGPLVIGGVLVLFMFKPIFARPPKGAKPMSVDERREPFLFEFIRRLCAAVGAPVPRRIDITCEVNASASFRRGALSMLGNDLVLTIGLPLVAGQNLRQFSGVLAHEFGHFAQGWAMRANYVVRTVNYWFARVVYQRDAMDEWLVNMANSDSHYAINIVLHLARFFVWLTRRVLWLLMVIGHLFSSLLSRQMEFDADRHAFRLVGRDPFSSALRELPVLGAAQNGAHQDLANAWREWRLADDLPQLIKANVEQITPEIRQKIISAGLKESAGMYASHPATMDRISAADNERDAGVFSGIQAPAQILFRDFGKLCRDATFTWYSDEAGFSVQKSNLVPTSTLVANYEREVATTKAAERILGQLWSGSTFFAPGEMAEDVADQAVLSKELESAEESVLELRRMKALMSAGVERRFDQGKDLQVVQERRRVVRERLGRAAAAAKLKLDAAQGEEAERLRVCLSSLAAQQNNFDDVREGFLILVGVLQHLDGHKQNEAYVGYVQIEMKQQQLRLLKMRDACLVLPYPFDHAQKGISVGHYLLADLPAVDDLGAIMNASEQVLRNGLALHHRALSRLAIMSESRDV
jgi:Peptidase family M48